VYDDELLCSNLRYRVSIYLFVI